MFKIIKKGSGNFWHNFNNGSKEVNLSDWEIVLDSVNQTVSLQMLNGANIPNNSVIISDVVVIDETDSSVEETFVSVEALRIRLVELNYTPYIVLNGFVPEAPIDGLTYGRKDAEWVEVSGGGGSTPDATTTVKGKLKLAGDLGGTADLPTVPNLANKANITDLGVTAFSNDYNDLDNLPSLSTPNLQQVTDNGYITTNPLISTNKIGIEAVASGGKTQNIVPVTGISDNQNFTLPNREGGGVIALVSDISTPTLQQVTDNGNTTTNEIEISNYIKASEFRSSADDITFADGSGNPIFFFASTGANQANFDKALLTADRNFSFPDTSGTIAVTSDIPTELSELTDDSTHRLVTDTQISTWDGKQNTLTETNFGSFMNARTAKNTLVDADEVVSDDSADSNKAKKTTWLNVWNNYLKPKADALYQAILTDINFGAFSNSLSDKTTPVDADTVNLVDSADSNKAKKLSFANLKAWVLSFVPTVITPETGIYYFNDFLGVFTTSTNDGNISSDANVGQTTTALNSDANKQGFANVNTSNATAGYGNIYIGHTATANFILGGGITSYETLIWLPSLSTSGERFSCLIGFSSGVLNQNNSSNNIAFLYDEGNIAFAGAGGASANWRAVTTDTAVRTFNDTGVAVNAGAFIKLKIIVNANASSVGFYIDNTLVATHTTNIPSGTSKRLSVRNYIQKSVGYTPRLLILDYIKLQQNFTTAR